MGDLGVAGSQRLCFGEKEFLGVWFSYSMVGRPLVSVNVLLGLTEQCKIAMNLTNKQYKASCKKKKMLSCLCLTERNLTEKSEIQVYFFFVLFFNEL